ERNIKKLFICTVISFNLVITILLIIFLVVDSNYGTDLSIVSLIPCVCYLVYGKKLLDALGIEKFHPIL
ncbi:MAG: hypothetical protein K0R31_1006, partial [Clostridiales bacterium]|nr:hypothetical protein [Clostridiales bacterium]